MDPFAAQNQAMQNAISILMRKKELAESRRRFDLQLAEAKAERLQKDKLQDQKIAQEALKAKIKYAQDMMKTAYEKGDVQGTTAFGSQLYRAGFPVPANQVPGPPRPGGLPPVQFFAAPPEPPKTLNEALVRTFAQQPEKLMSLYQQKLQQKPATPTDIDDFVEDANRESIRLTGKSLTPGKKNEARLQFKRAQAGEVRANRLASRTADAQTAEKIKYNEGIGKALAEIETTSKLISAKGEETPQQKMGIAKNRMSGNLAKLANHYIKLDSMGAILNVDKSSFENIIAGIKSSTLGQSVASITGSNAQSIRNSIKKLKPLLIQDIRQSTNMGARGLDSEKELEFYLQAATDEKTDIQSNIAAIVVLDEAFGNGQIAQQLKTLTDKSLIRNIAQEGSQILHSRERRGAAPAPAPAPQKMTDADRRTEELLKKYERKSAQ